VYTDTDTAECVIYPDLTFPDLDDEVPMSLLLSGPRV